MGLEAIYFLLAAPFGYAYKQYYGYQTTRTACSLQASLRACITRIWTTTRACCFTCWMRPRSRNAARCCWPTIICGALAGPEGWTAAALDDFVEAGSDALTGLKVDFEIGDALAKLQRLGFVPPGRPLRGGADGRGAGEGRLPLGQLLQVHQVADSGSRCTDGGTAACSRRVRALKMRGIDLL